MLAGSAWTARAGTTMYSDIVPFVGGDPKHVPTGQMLYCPERQVGQTPHPIAGSTATRVPVTTPLLAPAAMTTPDASWPSTVGWPRMLSPLRPAA